MALRCCRRCCAPLLSAVNSPPKRATPRRFMTRFCRPETSDRATLEPWGAGGVKCQSRNNRQPVLHGLSGWHIGEGVGFHSHLAARLLEWFLCLGHSDNCTLNVATVKVKSKMTWNYVYASTLLTHVCNNMQCCLMPPKCRPPQYLKQAAC